eukprot:385444_1
MMYSIISIKEQTLIFNGKQLNENMSLIDYNITNLCIIHVICSFKKTSNETNNEKSENKPKITLHIDLSQLLPFCNHNNSSYSITCPNNTNIKSIIDKMDLTYISNFLIITFHGETVDDTDVDTYTSIEYETISGLVPSGIDRDNIHIQLGLTQTVSLLSTQMQKSIALIFNQMKQYTSYPILPSIFKLLSYTDNQHRTEVIQVLITCLISVSSDNETDCIKIILKEMDEKYCDPLQDKNYLYDISQFLYELSVDSSISNDIRVRKIPEQLYTLILYEDSAKVLINVLDTYWAINRPKMLFYTNVDNNYVLKVKNKYVKKQYENRIIVSGYIRKSLIESNIDYIPTDLLILMYNIYDCYKTLQMNLMWRIISLLNKNNNGYSRDVAQSAFDLCIEQIIPPLQILKESFIKANYDENMLSNIFWDYGLIKGLFVLLNDKKYHCISVLDIGQSVITQILNVINFLVIQNNIKDLCIREIEAINQMDFWNQVKDETEYVAGLAPIIIVNFT